MEQLQLDDQFKVVKERDGSLIYQMQNETGTGTIAMYEVFPGCMLAYNGFHMNYCDSHYYSQKEIFCIDHCREGRIEYATDANNYGYVVAGDLKIDGRDHHDGKFSFPSAHYHGITINFEMDQATLALKDEIKDFPVDLKEIKNKFCKGSYPMVIHQAPSIEHIFNELYAVPLEVRKPYFKLKVFELLLYLQALVIPDKPKQQPYFYKGQVEKIKAIEKLLTHNLERYYTQEELSKRFDIPLTPMKKCFKNVYGEPINGYMRNYRMNKAAVLLKTKNEMNVAQIAGSVGYDSPSKFAAAFKEIMGFSPLEYRKRPQE